MERIDVHPTHICEGYSIRSGRPYPFGATLVPGGINFSVFSRHASYCVLVLYRKGEREPMVEIPFRGIFKKAETGEPVWGEFRIGNVFTMTVLGLDYESIEYGYRMDGPYESAERGQPGIFRFNPDRADEGKNPLQLDSKAPSIPLTEFAYNELRYRSLLKSNEERAEKLMKEAQKEIGKRWSLYEQMAQMDYSLEEEEA